MTGVVAALISALATAWLVFGVRVYRQAALERRAGCALVWTEQDENALRAEIHFYRRDGR